MATKLTLNSMDVASECTIVRFDCDFTVVTAGDGLWGCEAGRRVHCKGICVITEAAGYEVNVQVTVAHDSDWDIYTDTAFERAISEALGFRVRFTEQGMQDEGHASMEA